MRNAESTVSSTCESIKPSANSATEKELKVRGCDGSAGGPQKDRYTSEPLEPVNMDLCGNRSLPM